IINNSLNTKALSKSLLYFMGLYTIELYFIIGLNYSYKWLTSQVLTDNLIFFLDYFKKLIISIIFAKKSRVLI
ncbi:hypothetical protein BP00DRAFT_331163, partial [Aspergillus indologenus CBS 114.80]